MTDQARSPRCCTQCGRDTLNRCQICKACFGGDPDATPPAIRLTSDNGFHGFYGFSIVDPALPAHELNVSEPTLVPGACAPVTNLYHAGQALAWVAGTADSLNVRATRQGAIGGLLARLMR